MQTTKELAAGLIFKTAGATWVHESLTIISLQLNTMY